MATLQKIALIFTIIGALNWGLIGIFDFNLVETVFTGSNHLYEIFISICSE